VCVRVYIHVLREIGAGVLNNHPIQRRPLSIGEKLTSVSTLPFPLGSVVQTP